MTTINCASNCIYQVEGTCTLDNISVNSISTLTDCLFFHGKTDSENVCENPK